MVSEAIASFERESAQIVRSAREKNELVADGPLELLGVNIYDARFYQRYITSKFFLLYRDGKGENTLSGHFVIEMADKKTIARVYRWEPF